LVTAFEDRPETARGRWAYQALIAIHRLIRRDLAAVERLAAAVHDGLPTAGLHEEIEALKSEGTIWQLQLSCLRHCEFVHLHHHMEDVDFFAELEETNPAIRPVVERLRAEHGAVSDLLDAVEVAAQALSADHGHDARRAVADALEKLRRHLLAHLEYEELSVASTARRLAELPSFG
jgi:Hemerythrin HHE cation binding domain